MGLMDKVKAQASSLAQQANAGMANINAMPAQRHADSLLRSLGLATLAERTGRSTSETSGEVDQLVSQLTQHESQNNVDLVQQAAQAKAQQLQAEQMRMQAPGAYLNTAPPVDPNVPPGMAAAPGQGYGGQPGFGGQPGYAGQPGSGGPQGFGQAGGPAGFPQEQPTGFPQAQPTGFPQEQQAGFPQAQQTGFPQEQATGFPQAQPQGFPQQGAPAGAPPQGGPTGFPEAVPVTSFPPGNDVAAEESDQQGQGGFFPPASGV